MVAYIRQNFMQAAVQYHFANPDGSWNGQTVAQQFGPEPIALGYIAGWLTFSRCFIKILLMLAVLLLIILAPIFSGEYSGMDQLLLTTRYGRSKCSLAKIAAAFLLTLTLTAAVLACNLLLAHLVLGNDGLDCSIVFNDVSYSEQSIPYNITCRTMLRYQILLAFTAVFMLTGIALLLSCTEQITFRHPNYYIRSASATYFAASARKQRSLSLNRTIAAVSDTLSVADVTAAMVEWSALRYTGHTSVSVHRYRRRTLG